MLTGPVTILNWSYPRIDVSREIQTKQLALALRDEVIDLEKAGIMAIQVDEPALREGVSLYAFIMLRLNTLCSCPCDALIGMSILTGLLIPLSWRLQELRIPPKLTLTFVTPTSMIFSPRSRVWMRMLFPLKLLRVISSWFPLSNSSAILTKLDLACTMSTRPVYPRRRKSRTVSKHLSRSFRLISLLSTLIAAWRLVHGKRLRVSVLLYSCLYLLLKVRQSSASLQNLTNAAKWARETYA